MDFGTKFSPDDSEPLVDPLEYQRVIGRLLYLTITCSNLSYSVSKLSEFVSKPEVAQMQAAYSVLIYIKGTVGQGLVHGSSSDLKLSCFQIQIGPRAQTHEDRSLYYVF